MIDGNDAFVGDHGLAAQPLLALFDGCVRHPRTVEDRQPVGAVHIAHARLQRLGNQGLPARIAKVAHVAIDAGKLHHVPHSHRFECSVEKGASHAGQHEPFAVSALVHSTARRTDDVGLRAAKGTNRAREIPQKRGVQSPRRMEPRHGDAAPQTRALAAQQSGRYGDSPERTVLVGKVRYHGRDGAVNTGRLLIGHPGSGREEEVVGWQGATATSSGVRRHPNVHQLRIGSAQRRGVEPVPVEQPRRAVDDDHICPVHEAPKLPQAAGRRQRQRRHPLVTIGKQP